MMMELSQLFLWNFSQRRARGMAVGIGLALMAASRGYRCILTVPETTDEHTLQLLRTLGAEVILCPAVPPTDEQHYIREARRAAQQTAGAALLSPCDRFDENSQCHHDTTAPEILRQTDGLLDAFVCAGDTGGALAGVYLYADTYRTAVVRFEESSRGQSDASLGGWRPSPHRCAAGAEGGIGSIPHASIPHHTKLDAPSGERSRQRGRVQQGCRADSLLLQLRGSVVQWN